MSSCGGECPSVCQGTQDGQGFARSHCRLRRSQARPRPPSGISLARCWAARPSAYGLVYVDEGKSISMLCREDGLVLRVLT